MSVKTLAASIGKTGLLTVNFTLHVRVTVVDVRVTFGRTDFQVTPVDGHGELWVECSRVSFAGKDDILGI